MTSATNLPTLYQNVMSGLPSDFARDVFLWATDRSENDRMCYVAEKFAREADRLVRELSPMLDKASCGHGLEEHDSDLMNFILRRHANHFFGGNLNPEYCS